MSHIQHACMNGFRVLHIGSNLTLPDCGSIQFTSFLLQQGEWFHKAILGLQNCQYCACTPTEACALKTSFKSEECFKYVEKGKNRAEGETNPTDISTANMVAKVNTEVCLHLSNLRERKTRSVVDILLLYTISCSFCVASANTN